MKKTLGIFVAALALCLAAPQARATSCAAGPNLVANCGFETGSFTSWTLTGNDVPGSLNVLYGVEGTDPFPLPGGTNPNSGSFQAFFADQVADPITLAQTLATTAGATYTVSYYLAEAAVGPGAVNSSASVSFGGTTLQTLTNISDQGYTRYTATGVASSGSTPLDFKFGNDIGEYLLDDVSVTRNGAPATTPEPGSWILTATGVLLLGCFSRSALKQRKDDRRYAA